MFRSVLILQLNGKLQRGKLHSSQWRAMFSSRNLPYQPFLLGTLKSELRQSSQGKLVGVQYISYQTIKLVRFLQFIVKKMRCNCILYSGEPCFLVAIPHTIAISIGHGEKRTPANFSSKCSVGFCGLGCGGLTKRLRQLR